MHYVIISLYFRKELTRSYRLKFQRNFFEHRIRNSENFSAYCQYVRSNPVRAGLVTRDGA